MKLKELLKFILFTWIIAVTVTGGMHVVAIFVKIECPLVIYPIMLIAVTIADILAVYVFSPLSDWMFGPKNDNL